MKLPMPNCQLCNKPFLNVFYDAAVSGRWGYICTNCFEGHGCKLGIGLGQRYQRDSSNNEWFMTAGGTTKARVAGTLRAKASVSPVRILKESLDILMQKVPLGDAVLDERLGNNAEELQRVINWFEAQNINKI